MGLVALCLACGTSRQVVTVSTISQPHVAGLGFDSECLTEAEPTARCRGDRIVVRGEPGQEEIVRGIQAQIQQGKYHRVVDESDPSLTVSIIVDSAVPEYRIQRTRQHFPKQCVEREEQCWSSRELNACLLKANQARNQATRDRMKVGCRQRHRQCRFICVTYREAYTTHKVDEVCNGSVRLDVLRFMDREGNAVGSDSGSLLGSPTLQGTSSSSLTQKGTEPSEVGEDKLCGYALGNAIKKARQHLSPFEVDVQVVFADLALPSYQGAINEIRFGRFNAAHRELDEAFESADATGLRSEDIAWIHHAKATVHHLQGQNRACQEQLAHATRLRPSLMNEHASAGGGYLTPEGHFKKLLNQCAR